MSDGAPSERKSAPDTGSGVTVQKSGSNGVQKNASNGKKPGIAKTMSKMFSDEAAQATHSLESRVLHELDGVESVKQNLAHLCVRKDILVKRLQVEMKMKRIMAKLPCFLICLINFAMAVSYFCPTEQMAMVHVELGTRFGLRDAAYMASLTTIPTIYSYMTFFENQNRLLRANSMVYWCEQRYYEQDYDFQLGAPIETCNSCRMEALWDGNVPSDDQAPPPDPNMATEMGVNLTRKVQDDMCRPVTGNYSRNCSDLAETIIRQNRTEWRLILERRGLPPNIRCRNLCGTSIGWEYCKRTCVVYQTRFQEKTCTGYAHMFNDNQENKDAIGSLEDMPTLDGRKTEQVFKCVDRQKVFEEDYTKHITCGWSIRGLGGCTPDYPYIPKYYLDGTAVYADMLKDPTNQIALMRNLSWIDRQTDTVALSTVVYTEGIEVFTYLKVKFDIDEVGGIKVSWDLHSYHEMLDDDLQGFRITISITIASGLLVLALMPFTWVSRKRNHDIFVTQMLELVSRLWLVLVCISLWGYVEFHKSMADHFDGLMGALIDSSFDKKSRGANPLVASYFTAVTDIAYEEDLMYSWRIVIYFTLYLQFIQLIAYFSLHPRMAALTDTLWEAIGHILHFMLIFILAYGMLAFSVYYILGDQLDNFYSFRNSLMSQARMIYGEYIYATGMDNNTKLALVTVYWLFAGTFMLVMFFVLLNFFLAIVVDGFVKVKGDMETNPGRNVFVDMIDVPYSNAVYWWYGFPRRIKIIDLIKRHVEEEEKKKSWLKKLEGHDDPFIQLHVLQKPPAEGMDWSLQDNDNLCAFLYHYFRKSARVLGTLDEHREHHEKHKPTVLQEAIATPSPRSQPNSPDNGSMKKKLDEIQQLKDNGLLTKEEFMELQASLVKRTYTGMRDSAVGGMFSDIQVDPKRTIDKE